MIGSAKSPPYSPSKTYCFMFVKFSVYVTVSTILQLLFTFSCSSLFFIQLVVDEDVSYTKVSVSALCSQGVSKQRSHFKYATEATPPRIVSVSSKLASMVRTSKQELEQKERIDAATVDKNLEENVVGNCQRQRSFEITDSKPHPASNKPSLQDLKLTRDGGPIPAFSANSPKVKRETKQPSKRKSFLDDQLNDFLFLTGVTSGYENSFKRVKNEWKSDKDSDETKDQEQNNKHDIGMLSKYISVVLMLYCCITNCHSFFMLYVSCVYAVLWYQFSCKVIGFGKEATGVIEM